MDSDTERRVKQREMKHCLSRTSWLTMQKCDICGCSCLTDGDILWCSSVSCEFGIKEKIKKERVMENGNCSKGDQCCKHEGASQQELQILAAQRELAEALAFHADSAMTTARTLTDPSDRAMKTGALVQFNLLMEEMQKNIGIYLEAIGAVCPKNESSQQ